MYVKYKKTRIDNSDLEDVKEETKEKKDKEHWILDKLPPKIIHMRKPLSCKKLAIQMYMIKA